MALTLPFRRLSADAESAARSGGWSRLGALIDRNFDEVVIEDASLDTRLTAIEENILTGTVDTTDATATLALTVPFTDDASTSFVAQVTAYCTGGAGGNVGAGAFYSRTGLYTKPGGTLTLVGATTSLATHESAGIAAAWTIAFNIVSNEINVNVTGGAADNVSWYAHWTSFRAPQ